MRIRLGYQLSITMLFVFVVLGVGLALVYLSFDRAKALSRSAAVTYIDRVAEHTADTVDRNFETVLQAVEVVKQFPSVQMGAISGDPQLYALMAALLREHRQLYNIYVGYDDGSFIELDALDRAGPAVRAQLGAPEQAAYRLVTIAKRLLENGGNRHTTFLSADLWPVSTLGAGRLHCRRRPRTRRDTKAWFAGHNPPAASRYLAALSAVIMAHNGTVDKFVGDAIMAIWNAPANDPDHVTNACLAALACRLANEELNAAFEREGWPAYRTRFGLHTGEAVVGNIGSEDRMNYTVLGATVNMAAKLEPLNKEHGTEILVSETVARRAAEVFDFRFVAEVNLKGFGNKVRVYELQAKKRSTATGQSSDCA